MSSLPPFVRSAAEALRRARPLTLALVLGSCSDGERRLDVDTEKLEPLLNLGECSAAWVPITGGNRSDSEPPAELLFSRGDLYFFRFQWGAGGATSSELVRFDVHSQSRALATTVLVPNAYSAPMWVDDSELVFTQSGDVRSVPMSGGEVRVRSSFGSAELGDIRWLGVSDGNFYFARYGQPGAIWKINLGGGPVSLFANLGPDWGYRIEPPLVPSSEGLLLNGPQREDDGADHPVTIVISGDGAIRELPYPQGSTSRPFLTPTGVIHIVEPPKTESAPKKPEKPEKPGNLEKPEKPAQNAAVHEIEQNAAAHPELHTWLTSLRGGEMTEFWPDRPATALPGHVESDGRDGWYVTATEPFNDGFLHDTLWQVRPNAESRRLACNPSPESSQIQTESRTGHAFAAGDGFVYLVSLRGESQFWELVQISYLLPEEQP